MAGLLHPAQQRYFDARKSRLRVFPGSMPSCSMCEIERRRRHHHAVECAADAWHLAHRAGAGGRPLTGIQGYRCRNQFISRRPT